MSKGSLRVAVTVIGLFVLLLAVRCAPAPPCSSTQEPDTVLEPHAAEASVRTCNGTDESLRVYCLVPCEGDACDDERTFNADCSIEDVAGGKEITLTPNDDSGETVVEIEKLPTSWAEKPTYSDHHFLVFSVGCGEGLSCGDNHFTIEDFHIGGSGEIIMTLAE
jgi:hypothetical protein